MPKTTYIGLSAPHLINVIIIGNVLSVLKKYPSNSVHCIVVSPPYWGLRDYGTAVWIGGDINCDHKGKPFRTKENINLHTDSGGNDVKNKNDFQPFRSVCKKCGAQRVDAQIGLEETPEEFTEIIFLVFEECKRILRHDGTLWFNMGDSYAGGNTGGNGVGKGRETSTLGGAMPPVNTTPVYKKVPSGFKPKDLVGVPWRLAFALQGFAVVPFYSFSKWADILAEGREKQDWTAVAFVEGLLRKMDLLKSIENKGWYLRQDIIWNKPNPMPESVTDRCTKSHEYIFLFSKNKNYYYDFQAILEAAKYDGRKDTMMKGSPKYSNVFAPYDGNPNTLAVKGHERYKRKMTGTNHGGDGTGLKNHSGNFDTESGEYLGHLKNGIPARNKRTVWTVPTKPFAQAHFATFPEDLIVDCIKAGTSDHGCCSDCGAPYERIFTKELVPTYWVSFGSKTDSRDLNSDENDQGSNRQKDGHIPGCVNNIVTTGWQPTCECNGKFHKVSFMQTDDHQTEQSFIFYDPAIPLSQHPVSPCVVLDPFNGAATTGLVAAKLHRDYIGIDLNEEYVKLSGRRLYSELGAFNKIKIIHEKNIPVSEPVKDES